MHGYVVPSRIGTLACTTLQLEFSVYSGKKNDVKKYVKNLELINKDKKKKEVVNVLGCERSEPGFESRRPESDFTPTHQKRRKISSTPGSDIYSPQ